MNRRAFLASLVAALLGRKAITRVAAHVGPEIGLSIRYIRLWDESLGASLFNPREDLAALWKANYFMPHLRWLQERENSFLTGQAEAMRHAIAAPHLTFHRDAFTFADSEFQRRYPVAPMQDMTRVGFASLYPPALELRSRVPIVHPDGAVEDVTVRG